MAAESDREMGGRAAGRTRVCLMAADVSGDQNAARLATALREADPTLVIEGAGGDALAGAGVQLVVRTTHLSFVGVFAAFRILPQIVRSLAALRRHLLAQPPDLVVLTDAELISMPLSLWLAAAGIPFAFFFPPQVWFWGRWRLRWLARLPRLVLCPFPQEAALYQAAGAPTVFTGHPLRDFIPGAGSGQAKELGVDGRGPLVALMPGSRRREVEGLLPVFLDAAKRLRESSPDVRFVLPVANSDLRELVEGLVESSGLADVLVYAPRDYEILGSADLVIQCSGTATLETALLGVPSVIAYQLGPIERWGARTFSHVKYIGMPNILLEEMAQPEHFAFRVDADRVAGDAQRLLQDDLERRRVKGRLSSLAEMLGQPGAMGRAAAAILNEVGGGVPGPTPALRRSAGS